MNQNNHLDEALNTTDIIEEEEDVDLEAAKEGDQNTTTTVRSFSTVAIIIQAVERFKSILIMMSFVL